MKKASILCVLCLMFSCRAMEKGSFHLLIFDGDTLGSHPEEILRISRLRIYGTSVTGRQFTRETEGKLSRVTVSDVRAEEWRITVEAVDENSNIIAEGRAVILVSSSEEGSVSVYLERYMGLGNLLLNAGLEIEPAERICLRTDLPGVYPVKTAHIAADGEHLLP